MLVGIEIDCQRIAIAVELAAKGVVFSAHHGLREVDVDIAAQYGFHVGLSIVHQLSKCLPVCRVADNHTTFSVGLRTVEAER